MDGIEINFYSIYYGEMVDVETESGISCSCTVHQFNRKGVLVGREYKFVPYAKIRRHPKGLCWEQKWIKWGYGYLPDKRTWRQVVYEITCRIITRLMRWAESQMHIDIIRSGSFQPIKRVA